MAYGPGKYDEACTAAREATGGGLVALIVMGGSKGSGFAIQCVHPEIARDLPAILREMANQLDADQPKKQERS